jgi:prepilin signal peptidase PulO-like enzyme (type II secretory pathway)
MMVPVFLTIPLAAYLTFQDCRTQHIPLLGLLVWVVIHGFIAYVGEQSFETFMIFLGLCVCIGVVQIVVKEMYIGVADLIVMTSFSAWMTTEQLPLFFMVCGGLGALTAIVTKSKRFPFMPALFASAFIIFIRQTFF